MYVAPEYSKCVYYNNNKSTCNNVVNTCHRRLEPELTAYPLLVRHGYGQPAVQIRRFARCFTLELASTDRRTIDRRRVVGDDDDGK